MSTPTLNVTVRANTDKFKSDMNLTTELAHSAVRRVTASVIEMNAGWLASQGAIGGATIAVGRFLPVINQVLLAYTAIKGAFDLVGYSIDLANKKIADWNDLADKANASGFSTDFFQRITKSGGEARDKIDDLTASLKKFNDATQPKLGGSDVQQRLDSLTKAGNFQGNTGISALGLANDSETRLRAIVSLIDQAMNKGERLAALDLAGTAFGPSVQKALTADSGYLDDMLKRADAMSKAQLVSPEDVGRAIELKERMDAAQQTLATKWKPIQDDLAKVGMNYHEAWVSINEDLAEAVGYATALYTALKQVPDWFANRIGGASIWTSLTNATTTPESRAASEAAYGISSDPHDIGMVAANAKLTAALQNHANVTNAMQQATTVAYGPLPDKSKNDKGDQSDTADAYDHATESIEKHTARLQADTDAVGKGAAAQEELRAEATLLTAAQQAGLPVTQKMRDQIQDLAQDAGDAAEALAKARVASQISVDKQTAFLTPEDAQIARQLASIYGDDIPAALASSEAAAMRFNNALRTVGTLGQDVTKGFAVDFETAIRNGSSAFDALKTAGENALSKIADKLTSMAVDNLWSKAFGGASSGGGLLSLLGIGASSATAGATWSSGLGAGTGGLSFPMFASGTDSAPGGLAIVGEKGPELVNLPKGSQVVPNGPTMAALNGGGSSSQDININVTVSGARGSQEIADAVNAGVGQALTAYRKSPQFTHDVGNANIKAGKLRVGR
ncbi:MAG TPA: hypothetical protein VHC94_19215 [Nitrobacter sp.]|nr:hypothetical protein [Nitrobacter sp.]